MTRPRTVLLTGAAGGVGTFLRASLPGYGYRLRLADLRPVEDRAGSESAESADAAVSAGSIVCDLRDAEAVRAAVRGVDAVVHLGGISLEDSFAAILEANVQGTYHLYEAVRLEGVRRVVFASSNHAVGYVPLTGGARIGSTVPTRPDTYYGLSKAFGENMASLYADKYGVETVSLRIGSCFAEPRTVRMLATWLSPADCARLVHAALTAPDVGHTVVNGISANTRAWWDLASARALGYDPQDDAEAYAETLLAAHGPLDPNHPDARYIGGSFIRTDPHRPG